ncbi:Uncharacterised protein [Mycobacteroides abscessus subsp. abscessus]|nr:Uncharacterised protein [Mycobacteroides abscessus subsp. abscessus]
MSGQVVAHQRQDLHHRVLGDTDAVAVGHLGDRDSGLDGRIQINVIRADTGRQCQLELRRLGNSLGTEVGRPERLGDNDIGVGKFLLEHRVGPVLIGGDHQLMAVRLQIAAQPEFTRYATQQLTGCEIDGRRSRQGLPVRVAVDHRQ